MIAMLMTPVYIKQKFGELWHSNPDAGLNDGNKTVNAIPKPRWQVSKAGWDFTG